MTTATASRWGKRFLVPEVIQISNMDCGPATLSAVLQGWGIRVNYGRLREACQADVDGTSIETLEDLAQQLGLDAEQVMLPIDYFFDAMQSLPAIVVVQTPAGTPHFVVYWRRHGGVVQVMNPGMGRQFLPAARFLEDLFVHSQAVPASGLVAGLRSPSFQRPLFLRLRGLGMDPVTAERLLTAALADGGWRGFAQLDAAARMVKDLVSAGGVRSGREAATLLTALVQTDEAAADIPESYWVIQAVPSNLPAGDEAEEVRLRGAVLVVVHNKLEEAPAEAAERFAHLPSDLQLAVSEPPADPMRALLNLLPPRELGVITLAALGTMGAAALQLGLDVLLRGMLHLAWYTRQPLHRIAAFAVGAAFVFGVCGLSWLLSYQALRLGRYLEIRLRAALFAKLPKLNDHYFKSRPISDMVERAHSLLRVRQLPLLGIEALRVASSVFFTALALAYFLPRQRWEVGALMTITFTVSFALQPLLMRLELRVRTYAGSLMKAYLDALIGLAPLRTHGGERALARQHEELLTSWVAARLQSLRYQVGGQSLQLVLGYGLVAWLVARYLGHGGDAAGLLLLFYWAVGLPASGSDLARQLQQYPDIRNVTARLLEPLGAPSDDVTALEQPPTASAPLAIALTQVSVLIAGHPVLKDVTVDIPAGTHVAVVGVSGSGKSTLLGLLLGFHKAASGTIELDGQPADAAALVGMRSQVAWVDPEVRLWNRSLFDNLHNGHSEGRADVLGRAVTTADLNGVIARLPLGLATPLGEGGRLVSGGEGQRVRLGRTLVQGAPRLVLLDEPFRGLDRSQRQQLLARVRQTWAQTTLLAVSHDIGSTLDFPRVLVIEDGRIVEAGEPAALRARPDSRYSALLKAEQKVQHGLWASAQWERATMVDGQLQPGPALEPTPEDA